MTTSRQTTRVDFVVDSNHDVAVSVLIHSLAEVAYAAEMAALDLGPEGNHVAGLAGATSMLARQLSARVFSEDLPAETEPETAAAA